MFGLVGGGLERSVWTGLWKLAAEELNPPPQAARLAARVVGLAGGETDGEHTRCRKSDPGPGKRDQGVPRGSGDPPSGFQQIRPPGRGQANSVEKRTGDPLSAFAVPGNYLKTMGPAKVTIRAAVPRNDPKGSS